DAEAKGFQYDTEEDFKTFIDGVATKAKEDGVSVSDFYKNNFGEYASEKNLASYIKETFYVDAYLTKLVDDNMPSEDEISSYYEENKKEYDLVDYRLFLSSPEIGEDDSDETKEAAIAAAKEKAEAHADEIKGGADFEEAAGKYEDSEATEEDAHLIDDMTYGYISSVYSDWLYEEGRTEGDTESFADEENNRYYVIQFVERSVPEDVNTTIGTTLSNDAVNAYKEELIKNYETKDVAGELRSVVFE
ncbi:MAG: peptidyl-prolyl cis-trans isomerase, partial [Lachnospiraceae bacterium]|nr:peptidyl-prolyl cis-trans isomerase [Lachnospiraceae bacterium]